MFLGDSKGMIMLLVLFLVHVCGYSSSFRANPLFRMHMQEPSISAEVLTNIPPIWRSMSLQRLQFLDKLELAESVTYPRYKTLILELTENSKYIAVCIPQIDRLCHKKLYDISNHYDGDESRLKISSGFKFAPKEIAENITGFLSGSIPPIGFKNADIPTYIDIQATREEKIIVGSGYPGISVCVPVVDLLENSETCIQVADVAVDPVKGDNHDVDDDGCSSATNDINDSNANEKQNISYEEKGIKFASIPLIDTNTERIHLVGVVAKKRSMSKKLVFLTIVPPEFAQNPNCMERLVLGYTKAWKSTIPNASSKTMEVQLILGKSYPRMCIFDFIIC